MVKSQLEERISKLKHNFKQQETQPTLHVKCRLKDIVNTCDTFMKSLSTELSDDTRDYLTFIGPPSCINLQ